MKDECSQRTFATELTRYACLIHIPGKTALQIFPGMWMWSMEI